MKRLIPVAAAIILVLLAAPVLAQQNAPEIPYVSVPNFLKYPPTMNLGETLGVAENSKGHIILLNHPGTATSGPLYGNATTNLLEFDDQGNFVREIGQGVYGFGYGHAVRFDNEDNLWVVDKGTNAVVKFNPAGYVVLNLGRRPEGFDGYEHVPANEARAVDGYFGGPTDVGWDAEGNIYVSDGYINSRVGKMDKWGNWIASWGSYGREDGQLRLPHNLQVDREGYVYVADRSNRRIQKYDSDGNLQKTILLNVPFDKTRRPALGERESQRAGRDAALDAVHFGRRDAVSVRVRSGAGPHLQDDAGRRDSGMARRVRPWTGAVQLDSRHLVPGRERVDRGRHEQLACAEAAVEPDRADIERAVAPRRWRSRPGVRPGRLRQRVSPLPVRAGRRRHHPPRASAASFPCNSDRLTAA